jgi:hypothetical protein
MISIPEKKSSAGPQSVSADKSLSPKAKQRILPRTLATILAFPVHTMDLRMHFDTRCGVQKWLKELVQIEQRCGGRLTSWTSASLLLPPIWTTLRL